MPQGQTNTGEPTNETQWAIDYLKELGAPATSKNDPRVKFLVAWENTEATFQQGNVNNPISIEGYPGVKWYPLANGKWNSQGVLTFPSIRNGLKALHEFMQQGYDQPILNALQDPNVSQRQLVNALAKSNWTGQGPEANIAYANAVASNLGSKPATVNAQTIQNAQVAVDSKGGYIGPGAWVVQLNNLLQGHSPSELEQISTLGTAGVVANVQTMVYRVMIASGFVLVGVAGFYLLGGRGTLQTASREGPLALLGIRKRQGALSQQVAELAMQRDQARANARREAEDRRNKAIEEREARRNAERRAATRERLEQQRRNDREKEAAAMKRTEAVKERELARLKGEEHKTTRAHTQKLTQLSRERSEKAKTERAATSHRTQLSRERTRKNPATLQMEKERTARQRSRQRQQESRERQAEITGK